MYSSFLCVQGDSIEEQSCASMTDCLGSINAVDKDTGSSEEMFFDSDPVGDVTTSLSTYNNNVDAEMDIFSLFQEYDVQINASSACNCGCIIHGLHAEKNYTLLVQISSQESFCLNRSTDPHWVFFVSLIYSADLFLH